MVDRGFLPLDCCLFAPQIQFYNEADQKYANAAFQFGASKEEMRLNLSGFYYGIYLNVGKK